MTTGSSLAEPRAWFDDGDRAVVHAALFWGLPERRDPDPESSDEDPVMRIWGDSGSVQAIVTQEAGFTLAQLRDTERVLMETKAIGGNAVRDCEFALAVVEDGIRVLGGL